MVKDLVDSESLGWVFFQYALQQVERFGRNRVAAILVVWFLLYDLLVEFLHVASFERHSAEKHSV